MCVAGVRWLLLRNVLTLVMQRAWRAVVSILWLVEPVVAGDGERWTHLNSVEDMFMNHC